MFGKIDIGPLVSASVRNFSRAPKAQGVKKLRNHADKANINHGIPNEAAASLIDGLLPSLLPIHRPHADFIGAF